MSQTLSKNYFGQHCRTIVSETIEIARDVARRLLKARLERQGSIPMIELPEEFDSPSGSYAKGSPWHNSIPLEKSLNDIIDFWQKNDRD